MAYNHEYPYVDSQMFNDDWLLMTVKELVKKFSEFVNINTIKYADPIIWNITTQYEANTVVVDGQNGNAYISTKPVPAGVSLSNTEYWTQIYNYAAELDTLRLQIARNEGQSTVATLNYNVNDLVFVQGLLWRVISPMIAGDQFVENSNVTKTSIEVELHRLRQDISGVNDAVTAEAEARAEADGLLDDKIEDETTARTEAVEAEADARADADSDLSDRITSNTNSIAALNRLTRNRRFLFVGDSYGKVEAFHNWTHWIEDDLNEPTWTYNYDAVVGGAGFDTYALTQGNLFLANLRAIENTIDDKDTVTDIVIVGGINDCEYANASAIQTAMENFDTYVKATYPNAVIRIGFFGYCAYWSVGGKLTKTPEKMRTVINAYITGAATLGWHYMVNSEYTMRDITLINDDGIHPNEEGGIEIAKQLSLGIKVGACDVHYDHDLFLVPITNIAGTITEEINTVTAITNLTVTNYHLDNDVVSFDVVPFKLFYSTTPSQSMDGVTIIPVATLNGRGLPVDMADTEGALQAEAEIAVIADANVTNFTAHCKVEVINGQLVLWAPVHTLDGGVTYPALATQVIRIYRMRFTGHSLSC